ncbi:MAG: chemotaxis response regulator protein-glutamate methylesterase [Candidatus Zixiibacteriota bacterium]
MTKLSDKVIKVLIVDDSAFMRKALSMMLESDPHIKIIGTARDGEEGIAKVKELKPDLVTMDIEMPRMDGLTALRKIMSDNPLPVMMVSSLTTDGAGATLDALELGAVDFIPKQLSYVSLDIIKIKEELLEKIKNIARRKNILMAKYRTNVFKSFNKSNSQNKSKKTSSIFQNNISKRNHIVSVIALGTSTGGPLALQSVVPNLPRNIPVGMLIAQHMPAAFTSALAERLNKMSQVTVKEAENGDKVEAGNVYIAPGGKQMTVKKVGVNKNITISDKPDDVLYKPCVDIMMKSVADVYGGTTLGVIMTGMGYDGLIGLKEVKARGGVIIAQDEETCIVYGMPKAVVDADIADYISPLDEIASGITSFF